MANRFCSFFTDKITNIRLSFPSTSASNIDPRGNITPILCDFAPVTSDSLIKLIKSKPCKTCVLDPWPSFLLIEHLDLLVQPITRLVNKSLSQGIFPESYKNAVITPLLKKPNLPPDDLKNYRPVSNLNFISKVIERVVASQFQDHTMVHNFENPFQSAYRSNHSTETALLKVKNDIHINLASGKITALVLLDLSAAFDTIDHGLLLSRLKSYFHIGGTVLNWVQSYLQNRTQSVKIHDFMSDKQPLRYGVPQGSVLGPLLFTMYMTPLADIFHSFPLVCHHIYADDTQVYIGFSSKNAIEALEQLTTCLSHVQLWMADNLLKLNPDKTEFILFGTKTQRESISHLLPLTVMGESLNPTDIVKSLGVYLDSNLSLSRHVSAVTSACFYHIRDLCRIKRYIDKSALLLLANALVRSRLDYCNSLFQTISRKDKTRLQRVLNTLCRIVTGASRFKSTTPILKSLHWLPIEFRIKFKCCLLIYKILNTGYPKYLNSCLQPYTSSRSTRMSNPELNLLATPFFNSRIHTSKSQLENSFYYSAPRLWNTLKLEIRSAPSISSFKSMLKTFLFQQAFPT